MFFCRPSFIKRSSSGRSAVAAAAYRAGERLHDDETGKNWKYDKKEVIDKGIVLPENAPAEYKDRQTLWNAVQKAEQSADARLARELVIAIPHDLDKDAAKIMIHDFAEYLAKRGMCVDYALHWKNGNHHAHIMLTTRQIEKDGSWAKYKEKKVYARDKNGEKIPLLDKDGKQKTKARKGKGVEKLWKRVSIIDNPWNKQKEYENWKRRLARLENRELIKAGSDVRVDSRSYKERGIEKVPQVHEGYAARAIESRGEKSFLCEHNREVRALNAKIEQTQELEKRIAELKKQKEQKPEQNAQQEKITICGFADLEPAQRKNVVKEVRPILDGLQKAYCKQFPQYQRQFKFKEDFFKNSVFAKTKDGVHLLNINKKNAVKCGLLEKNGGAKTFAKDQLKDMGKSIKAVGKAVQSLFDDKVTSGQHLKNAKDNIVNILKTPPKAVLDIVKNPVTGILSLPGKIFSMVSNAAEAAINFAGAVLKGGSDTPAGKLSDGISNFPVNWATLSPLERERKIKKMEEEELERLCGSIDYKAPAPPPKASPMERSR